MSNDPNQNDEEIARRMDDAVRRALNTPPKPHSAMKLRKSKTKTSKKANPPKKSGRPKKGDDPSGAVGR
jgi:hypothetical protein